MSYCNGHNTKKTSIENHFQTAGVCCSRLPRQQQRRELLHPQSRALHLSLSSHVRCVGEWRLWFLCLYRPVGFISRCTALLLDILLQRRHLLFSSWNLTSVCDQSLPVKRKKEILIHSCGVWLPWVCRVHCSLRYLSCSSFAWGFPVSITVKISEIVKLKLLSVLPLLLLQHHSIKNVWFQEPQMWLRCATRKKRKQVRTAPKVAHFPS